MRLTPPTNMTFGISMVFGLAGLGLGLFQVSFGLALALVGLALLAIGNMFEKI